MFGRIYWNAPEACFPVAILSFVEVVFAGPCGLRQTVPKDAANSYEACSDVRKRAISILYHAQTIHILWIGTQTTNCGLALVHN